MMEHWPPWLTLVLISVSTLCQDGRAEPGLTIDWVKLTILPGNTVERGTSVILRCEAKVSHSSPRLMYTFTFTQYETVVYSKNSSEAVVERIIASARASNSGSYSCGVQAGTKDKSSETQALTVKGLQTPQLTVRPDVVYEGDEIQATCSATEENSTTFFNFYIDDNNPKSMFAMGSATTTMELKKTGVNNVQCNYRNVLHFGGILSNFSNTVQVIVQRLNIDPSITIQPSANVVEGDRVFITCNVSGYNQSDLEIFLTKDDILVFGRNTFTHSLFATAEKSGEYVCKAEKGKVQKIATGNVFVSELFSAPVLTMTPEQIFEGELLSISCRSFTINQNRINHSDVTYTLYKNKRLLTKGHTYNTTASQDMNGDFSCVAWGKGINKTSKHLNIQVKVPVSKPNIGTVGQVILKKPFQILCESMGTLPITYTLLKSQRPVFRLTATDPLRSVLFNVSYIVHKEEIHSFTCQAENHGARYSTFSNSLSAEVIEPVSKPVLTLSTKDRAITEGMEVILYCGVRDGTVPVTFSWYRRGFSQPLYTTRLYKNEGKHTIKPISREHRGNYYCEASNNANLSNISRDVLITVNLADWKKAVIAVICILVLVLIVTILVLFLKNSRAPRKRKREVELSVKSARPKSNDPMRMSLTLDIEDNTAVNSTPGVMGRNVWCEHVSDSESDDPSREEVCEELQYTEVHHQHTVDNETSVQDTNAVNSEAQDCKQDTMDDEEGSDSAVEYVQLNHAEQDPA